MRTPEAIVGLVLLSHLILSAAYQFGGRIHKRLANVAEWLTLPTWTFFAPNPGVHDYRLVVRYKAKGGEWRPWEELNVGWRSCCLRWLWNPEKIGHKALCDCIQMLTAAFMELPKDSGLVVYLTRPYLTVVNYVERSRQDSGNNLFQFAVIQTHGFIEPRNLQPLFLSLVHSCGI